MEFFIALITIGVVIDEVSALVRRRSKYSLLAILLGTLGCIVWFYSLVYLSAYPWRWYLAIPVLIGVAIFKIKKGKIK
jgi:hypothetical protein